MYEIVVYCTFVVCSYDGFDFFFFFNQKTAYEMRISDWSSDVCSSDLMFYGQKNMRNAKIAGGVGAVLILVAAVLFATRPDAHAEIAEEAAKTPVTDAPKLAQGSLLCTIRLDRSCITVTAATDVPITIGKGGCVNGRPQ